MEWLCIYSFIFFQENNPFMRIQKFIKGQKNYFPQYSWVQNSYCHRNVVDTMIHDGCRVLMLFKVNWTV